MPKICTITFSIISSSLILAVPALAEGMITVNYPNGESDNYSNVRILSNKDLLSIKNTENDGKILEIARKECHVESLVSVCTGGTVTVDTYGVRESLQVKQMYIFINNTTASQPIKDSKVTLDPQCLMAEILTQKGTYINVSGKIDSPLPRP
jgi:hypothetical protein